MEPLANALNISMLELIRAEKMKNENDSIADEIIKESLAICVEKIKQAKKCAGIGLLASYVTLGVGTIFACYYINCSVSDFYFCQMKRIVRFQRQKSDKKCKSAIYK